MSEMTTAEKRFAKKLESAGLGPVFPPLGCFALGELKPKELAQYNAQHGTAHTADTIRAEIKQVMGK